MQEYQDGTKEWPNKIALGSARVIRGKQNRQPTHEAQNAACWKKEFISHPRLDQVAVVRQ
jgi:hypothetical protein